MKIVILAGGLGTRISEESHLKPKPMIEIGGKPILWHIMKYYSSYGFNDFIICCGYKGEKIKEFFANYFLYGSDVTFDFTNDGKLEIHNNVSEPWKVTVVDTGLHTQTGGRVKRIKKYVGNETFMLTYGDGVSDVNLHELLSMHRKSNNIVTLTSVRPSGRYGILDLDDSRELVVGFREKEKKDSNWINAGFMVVDRQIFRYISGDETVLEENPLRNLSKEEKLGVYKHYGFWQCMDTQRDKAALEWHIENGAPWMRW